MASSKKQPAAKKPAAKQPAAKQPAAKQPAAKQPAAKRPAPPVLGTGATLVVMLDGVVLPDPEAAAIWDAFSLHMDHHERDLAGFARARGWREVRPEHRRGQAVLVVTS